MRRIAITLLFLSGILSAAQTFPSTISSLAARWEADCITFSGGSCSTPSNGSSVTAWNDQSGNGNTFNITAGTCTFNTNQLNSLPAVNFNATCHGTITSINLASGGSTMYAVVKLAATSGGYALVSGVHTNSINWWFSETVSSVNREQGLDATTNVQMGKGNTASDTSWHQLGWGLTTNCQITGSFFRINGAADGSVSTNGSNPCAETVIGWNGASSNQIFNGQVAALFIWTKLLSSTERNQVECYLWSKYATGNPGCRTRDGGRMVF